MNRLRHRPAVVAMLALQLAGLVALGSALGIAFAELVIIPVFAGGGHG